MKTSIVVVSKNDGYGGHLEFRAELALQTMIDNYDEVVYVDWCSGNNKSLLEELNLNGRGNLRHIPVTDKDLMEINASLVDIPIVEVLGRNIGIRRATGDWIVSSNIDVMPAPLPYHGLDTNFVYVVRRSNVGSEVFLQLDKVVGFERLKQTMLQFSRPPIIENNHWAGRYDPWSLIVCVGDFQAAHRDLWYKMRGFEESMVYRDFADTNLMKKASIYGLGGFILDFPVFHLDHGGHVMQKNGISLSNDWDRDVVDFTETTNKEDWGLINYEFNEQIV